MTRVRIFICAGAGLALAAFGWWLPDLPGSFAGISAASLSRSAGLALLGLAMLAAGLVFRAAMAAPRQASAAKLRPRASEFRSGFSTQAVRAKAQLRQPTQREVVVALRRAVADQASTAQPLPANAGLPPAEFERLQNLLEARAARLRARHSEQAKRYFLRSGVDRHADN